LSGLEFLIGTILHALLLAIPIQEGNPKTAPPLTLEEALRLADANHPKILGAQAERQAATAKRVSKQGAFDTNAIFSTEGLRYNSASSRGKASTATVAEAGVEVVTRPGLKIYTGVRRNLGSVKSPLSATGDLGEFYVGVKLPLLRGFGVNEKSAAERQAFFGEGLADQAFAARRLETLAETGLAYWDWAAAGAKRTVVRDLLTIAETRAAQVRTRVQNGDLPAIDAVEADTEVQRRQGALIKAERDLQKAGFYLARYLWPDDATVATARPPDADRLPPALPEPKPIEPTMLTAGRDRAIARRPELQSVAVTRSILGVDRELAENDRKPNLDFVLSPGQDVGAGGIGNTMKAGILYSVPLQRREATGRRDEALWKLEKLAQEESLLRQQIGLEVEDAVSAVNAAYERYLAAVREVELAKRLEQGERDRYALGEGTLFLVNQRERATAEAQARLLDVQAEYQQALLVYRAATADL
jgi:outer membrane protein